MKILFLWKKIQQRKILQSGQPVAGKSSWLTTLNGYHDNIYYWMLKYVSKLNLIPKSDYSMLNSNVIYCFRIKKNHRFYQDTNVYFK